MGGRLDVQGKGKAALNREKGVCALSEVGGGNFQKTEKKLQFLEERWHEKLRKRKKSGNFLKKGMA